MASAAWTFRLGANGAGDGSSSSTLSTSSNWPHHPSFPRRISIGKASQNLFRMKRQSKRDDDALREDDGTVRNSTDATSSSTSSPSSSSSSSSPVRDGGTKNTNQDSNDHFNCGSDSNCRLKGPQENRSTWKMLKLVFGGLASVLGVGVFVIIGHVANDVAGPAIISSLIIAAVTSLLSGKCS